MIKKMLVLIMLLLGTAMFSACSSKPSEDYITIQVRVVTSEGTPINNADFQFYLPDNTLVLEDDGETPIYLLTDEDGFASTVLFPEEGDSEWTVYLGQISTHEGLLINQDVEINIKRSGKGFDITITEDENAVMKDGVIEITNPTMEMLIGEEIELFNDYIGVSLTIPEEWSEYAYYTINLAKKDEGIPSSLDDMEILPPESEEEPFPVFVLLAPLSNGIDGRQQDSMNAFVYGIYETEMDIDGLVDWLMANDSTVDPDGFTHYYSNHYDLMLDELPAKCVQFSLEQTGYAIIYRDYYIVERRPGMFLIVEASYYYDSSKGYEDALRAAELFRFYEPVN